MLTLVLLAGLLFQQPEVTVALYQSPPYVQNENGQPTGSLADKWKEVASKNGLQSRYIWFTNEEDARLAVLNGSALYILDPKHAESEVAYRARLAFGPTEQRLSIVLLAALLCLGFAEWFAIRNKTSSRNRMVVRWALGGVTVIACVVLGLTTESQAPAEEGANAPVVKCNRAILTRGSQCHLLRPGERGSSSPYLLSSPFSGGDW